MVVAERCTFCSIIAGELPSVQIYRDSQVIVIMDKYPINTGHTLVIPLKHYKNLLEMPAGEVSSLYMTVPTVARAVVSAVKADGFNIGQNNGIAANQIVPHVHVHVVPRFNYDSPDGRWPSRSVAANTDLEHVAGKIKQNVKMIRH